jgi:hypothetical protein
MIGALEARREGEMLWGGDVCGVPDDEADKVVPAKGGLGKQKVKNKNINKKGEKRTHTKGDEEAL